MKIIQRLYLKDFFRVLMLLTFGLSFMFSLIDLIGKIDSFMGARASVWSLSLYAFYIMPKVLIYLLPMSVLTCSLFVFSQAFRRNEIAAIKAAGGRIRRLFYPFIATGFLLSVFAFITSEIVVPAFSAKASELQNRLSGKEKKSAFSNGSIWLKSKDGSPVKIDFYVPEKKVARGVSIFISGKDFLKEQIIAREAFWNGQTWILNDVTRYHLESGEIEKSGSMGYPGLDSPDLFAKELMPPDEMGIYELFRYIQRLQNAGFSNHKLVVDLYSKMSFPLINIFMMMLGLALSTRARLGGGLVTAGLGLLVSLFFWMGYTFSLFIGYAGILPPVAAAWSVPFLSGAIALYLFLKTPE